MGENGSAARPEREPEPETGAPPEPEARAKAGADPVVRRGHWEPSASIDPNERWLQDEERGVERDLGPDLYDQRSTLPGNSAHRLRRAGTANAIGSLACAAVAFLLIGFFSVPGLILAWLALNKALQLGRGNARMDPPRTLGILALVANGIAFVLALIDLLMKLLALGG